MTSRAKRFFLSAGAVAMAVAMAGASVGAQNQNTNSGQPPFRGRGMGPEALGRQAHSAARSGCFWDGPPTGSA